MFPIFSSAYQIKQKDTVFIANIDSEDAPNVLMICYLEKKKKEQNLSARLTYKQMLSPKHEEYV